jgi:hypothetical protein
VQYYLCIICIRFYPYVLMVSSVFLVATLIVYTVWSKQLLNHYTRVMRHFTFTMALSFVVLSINQMYSFSQNYPTLCIFFGKYSNCLNSFLIMELNVFFPLCLTGFTEQYLFLASFALMSAMSCEIWFQIRYIMAQAMSCERDFFTLKGE